MFLPLPVTLIISIIFLIIQYFLRMFCCNFRNGTFCPPPNFLLSIPSIHSSLNYHELNGNCDKEALGIRPIRGDHLPPVRFDGHGLRKMDPSTHRHSFCIDNLLTKRADYAEFSESELAHSTAPFPSLSHCYPFSLLPPHLFGLMPQTANRTEFGGTFWEQRNVSSEGGGEVQSPEGVVLLQGMHFLDGNAHSKDRERAGTALIRRAGHPYERRAPAAQKKLRTSFSKAQIAVLERRFAEQKYLASSERAPLAMQLRMQDAQVKTWFQNRRTKWRRQEAEEREFEHKLKKSLSESAKFHQFIGNPIE